jgi:hypothetical protein
LKLHEAGVEEAEARLAGYVGGWEGIRPVQILTLSQCGE